MGKIFSPGKLLLTSEYAVLDGALALAVPTQLGQEFFFEEKMDGKSLVTWEAFHQEQHWLHCIINYQTDEIVEANIPEAAEFVKKVLKNTRKLSLIRFQNGESYLLKTNLQFPSNFGLGSSSTLMSNIAEWAEIDPFLLNEISLGGSGYDVAVAREKSTVLFQKLKGVNRVEKINFNPPFQDRLIFLHLNKKQDSRKGIEQYRAKDKSEELIKALSEITRKVLEVQNLEEFSFLMSNHEEKLSQFLGLETVKEKYFQDCPTFVKSLGAWGGDFVMSSKFPDYSKYFHDKGFHTIFSWEEIIA